MMADAHGRTVTSVDVHAHFLGYDVVSLSSHAVDGPHLVEEDGVVRLAAGGATKPVPTMLWSVPARLEAMDRGGVSHQVLSPVPAVMEHAWIAQAGYATEINAMTAQACADGDGRLIGLGCLSAAEWDEELTRVAELGFRGIQVGSRIGGLDLDDPILSSLWRRCEAEGLCVFVHPVDGGRGVLRRAESRLDVGFGMLADTAVAAYSLVFGGVLEAFPDLKVVMAHGGGAFAWIYPRLRDMGGVRADQGHFDDLVRRLHVDTLVLDSAHLSLLVHHFGADRVVLGSDCPFLPHRLDSLVHDADVALARAVLDEADARDGLLASNAVRLLGL